MTDAIRLVALDSAADRVDLGGWLLALCDEVDRLRAENTALADALADIAGMRRYNDGTARQRWIADGECAHMECGTCWEHGPDDPDEWCPVCVAEVAWSAWKMGALA